MFKAVITEENTDIKGTKVDILTGLVMYIKTLIEGGFTIEQIIQAVELALEDKKDKKSNSNKVKIQKFDLNNMSKEEAIKLVSEELNTLFD